MKLSEAKRKKANRLITEAENALANVAAELDVGDLDLAGSAADYAVDAVAQLARLIPLESREEETPDAG